MVHEVEDSIMHKNSFIQPNGLVRLTHITVTLWATVMLVLTVSCGKDNVRHAPSVEGKDSLPFMQSYGISTLISDSGIIRYKIVAEEWNIYNTTNPPKWTFVKGILLEKFDSTFHIDWFVQSDTAYCYNQQLWELRGRVFIRNQEGTVFTSEELFWDMDRHEIYSNMFMTIRTPERMLQGYNFRSNEQMTRYHVQNSNGETPFNTGSSQAPSDSVTRTAPVKTH